MKYDYLLININNNNKVLFDSKKSIKEFIELNIKEIKSKNLIFDLIRKVNKVEKIILKDVVKNILLLEKNIIDENLIKIRKEKLLEKRESEIKELLNK